MRRDPRAYLWDVREAGRLISAFVHDKTYDDFLISALLRSEVERQFEVIGEALSQLAKIDQGLASRVP